MPIGPLVVAPQIAKPPARAQNVLVRAASARARTARLAPPVEWIAVLRPPRRSAVCGDAPILGIVAEHRHHQRDDGQRSEGDHQQGRPPGLPLDERSHHWDEAQLTGGAGGGQDAHHQAAGDTIDRFINTRFGVPLVADFN